MKKRLLPLALALALGLGLMIPTAFAVDGIVVTDGNITFNGVVSPLNPNGEYTNNLFVYFNEEGGYDIWIFDLDPDATLTYQLPFNGSDSYEIVGYNIVEKNGRKFAEAQNTYNSGALSAGSYTVTQADIRSAIPVFDVLYCGKTANGRDIYARFTGEPTTSSGTGSTVQVTASALNVRSGPGTSYGVTSVVYKGSTQTIVETQNNWGKLSSGGWIYLPYTTAVSSGTTTSSGTGTTVQVTASALNVRSGPGMSYGVTSVVYKGSTQTIVETQNNWGKLSGGGWIYLAYTTGVSSGSATSGSSTGSTVQVTASALYVRSGPGVSYGAISAVYQGNVLTIVETKTYSGGYSWGKLSSGGWVYLAYTKPV